MAKIIFTSHYMRDAPSSQLENYFRYISTCEGIEKLMRADASCRRRKKLVQQILQDVPPARRILEYEDFYPQPAMGNASEFICMWGKYGLDINCIMNWLYVELAGVIYICDVDSELLERLYSKYIEKAMRMNRVIDSESSYKY